MYDNNLKHDINLQYYNINFSAYLDPDYLIPNIATIKTKPNFLFELGENQPFDLFGRSEFPEKNNDLLLLPFNNLAGFFHLDEKIRYCSISFEIGDNVSLDFNGDGLNEDLEIFERNIFIGSRTDFETVLLSIQNFDIIAFSSLFALIIIVFIVDSRNEDLSKNRKSCQIEEYQKNFDRKYKIPKQKSKR